MTRPFDFSQAANTGITVLPNLPPLPNVGDALVVSAVVSGRAQLSFQPVSGGGPGGGIPEAPTTGGLVYGRQGSSTSWLGVLPLTGGTLSGPLIAAAHLTGSTTNSNVTLNTTAVGSGVNGPATAQIGLSINAAKDNWYVGTAAVGEIDGLNIMARQGGALSDCGGLLVNVVGTGTGFLAINECVVQQQQVNTGTPLYGIRTQEGGMDTTSGERIGKMYRADYGALTTAILTINTPGQGSWGYVFKNTKNNVENFTIDDNGNIYAPAATFTSADAHINGQLYLRGDTAVGVFYNSGTGGIRFNLSGNAAEILGSGGLTIFGTKVVGTRVTGWGAATGGSKAAFAAGSATLPQTAAALAQLIADLTTHGLIGT